VFGREHAEVYEIAYRGRGKDWRAEALDVTTRIRQRLPGAASLLDVACGTGAHLQTFAEHFPRVAGLEFAPAMRERARRKLPGTPIHAADMREFQLQATFDAVTCLFTAINFLETVAEMRAAITAMARHLVPGGVLVVEPWWFPDRFIDGHVGGDLVRDGGRVIARVSHSTREGCRTRMEERWVVGDQSGLREFSELGFLTMFDRSDYVEAFRAAGCRVEYLSDWLTGRGLFVGVRAPAVDHLPTDRSCHGRA
jgi:dTDP-4-amino-2,4-dideoxy-beta-L-xylose N-methyltransferase